MSISKREIRLINKVYQHSKRFLLRYPLSDSERHRLDYENGDIEELMKKGILVIAKDSLRSAPHLKMDVIRVHPAYERYVSQKTKAFLEEKRKEFKERNKQNTRHIQIDDYKHERNPWMGSRLRNGGRKVICTECMALNKPCEHGEAYHKVLPPDARVPRSNASKTRWKQFRQRFLKSR